MDLQLLGGAYEARSVLCSAQACINLYPELNPKYSQAPTPVTHYLTPGLRALINVAGAQGNRCTYTATNGDLYRVIGTSVYYVNSDFAEMFLGTIGSAATPASMSDNGLVVILVDNSNKGYAIDMASRQFAPITDPSFYGGTSVCYLDTFFILNRPNTNQFYISQSLPTFEMLTGVLGSIISGSITTAGTGYIGTEYFNVPLTGGTGSGATANIRVTAGGISSVVIAAGGSDYVLGDQLSVNSANVGGSGSGLVFTVDFIGGYAFDPLDIAAKVGRTDPIANIIVIQGYLWLVGTRSTEVWYNSGKADFTFERLPGVNVIEHGTCAPYSLVAQDLFPYFIANDNQGNRIIMKGDNYQLKRISTHAIENELSKYENITDCVAFSYQQLGHTFIGFNFTAANASWFYDEASELWHQRCWTDNDGNLNRARPQVIANAYDKIVAGDWQNGNLYHLDINSYTDNGQPISRIRSWPLVQNSAKRVSYNSFIADMDCGSDDGSIDDNDNLNPPVVFLRWSDNRGKTWTNRIPQSIGARGQYDTCVQFQRIGYGRYRVFELSWSAPAFTALNEAFVTDQAAGT